jgi:putative ABC transport system permease protein
MRSATISGSANVEPTEITLMSTSPRLFDMLGVRPVLGRGFMPDEAGDGRRNLVVLGHSLWSRLGADSSIVGRDIRLDGQLHTVIGVMGRSFDFMRHQSLGPPESADAWTTFDYSLATTDPRAGSFAALIRARPGSSFPVVAEAIAAAGRVVDERDFRKRGLRLYPVALAADLVAGVRPALVALGVAGLFLLLVLLVNLATLLLARAAQREQEFAVCRALGANSGALARATMLEGAMLGALGGGGGALLAAWGIPLLMNLAPLDLPRRASVAMDWRISLVVIVIGTLLGLAAGAIPATWAARARLDALLRGAAVRGGGGHGRWRRGMVAVQVGLSLVLLSSGALVVRSFERLLRASPGFEASGVLTFRLPVPGARYPDDTVANALHARVQQALSALPGVTAVGAVSALPLSSGGDQTGVLFPGAPGNSGVRERDNPLTDYFATRAGYTESMGIRLLDGRTFAPAFVPGAREALIDRTLAEQFWPGGSPVGRSVILGADTLSIVGVVEHARLYDVHKDGRGQVYIRNEGFTYGTMSWTLRSDRPPRSLIPEVRAAVRLIDPELAIADALPMEDLVSASLNQQRLTAVLIGGFSIGALLLAAMGLFGVVAGSVTRRRHEIAVRLALGADYGRVLRVVIGEGASLIALGLLIGAPGIYFAGQAIRGTLVGISPFDPVTLVSVAAGLALVAMISCYVPARRIVRIEPARALREE